MEIVFDGDKTLNEILLELLNRIEEDEDYIIGLCQVEKYIIEIMVVKRDDLDN